MSLTNGDSTPLLSPLLGGTVYPSPWQGEAGRGKKSALALNTEPNITYLNFMTLIDH